MKRRIIIALMLSAIYSGVSFAAASGEMAEDAPVLKGDDIHTMAENRGPSDFDGTLLAIDRLTDIPTKDGNGS